MIKRIEQNRYRLDLIFCYISLLGILGIYVGIVNMYFWIFLLITRLAMCRRIELGIFLLFLGSSLWGRLFASKELVLIFTIIPLLVGMFILRKEILKILVFNKRSFLFFSILILYFTIMFLLGPQNEYAKEKILKLFVRGYVWLVAFLIYVQTYRISNRNLAILFIILALFYLSQSYQLYGVRPAYLGDISFFRNFSDIIGRTFTGGSILNTHTLAYLSLGALTFWLSDKRFLYKKQKGFFILFFLLSFSLILISGVRQALVGVVIILALRLFLNKKKIISFRNFFTLFVIFYMLISVVSFFSSEYLEKTLSQQNTVETRLNRDFVTPFRVLAIDPVFGVGFGGYPDYANKNYPHNLFLEILCELGIVGFIFILLCLLLFWFGRYKIKLIRYKSINGAYLFLLFALFFIRSMISGDLAENIILINLLLCFNKIHPLDVKYINKTR
ncbi:O-antigen ligase family protein [Sanguibacteroides justesenii]|nr:O-antigen ligase family protein [Sanguibacteroides justesenii]